MKTFLSLFASVAIACFAGSVFAQQAGDWMIRGGYGTIAPHVSSGNLTAPSITGTKADVGTASNLMGGVTYMYTDNVSIDLPLALSFKHKLYGAGALAGTGQLGEVQALPISLFLQYRFNAANDTFRPYLGLGPTYAYFFNANGNGTLTALTNPGGSPTGLSVRSKLTYTYQVGATYAIDRQWFVDFFYSNTPLKTQTTFSTGQTLDITLNPAAYGLTLGYRF